jgi:hypothetical protein
MFSALVTSTLCIALVFPSSETGYENQECPLKTLTSLQIRCLKIADQLFRKYFWIANCTVLVRGRFSRKLIKLQPRVPPLPGHAGSYRGDLSERNQEAMKKYLYLSVRSQK